MTEPTRVFSVSLPVEIAEQVERMAATEGRSVSEVFEESFRAYRVAEVRKIANEIQAEFQRAGITGTEEDVEQWVEEVRAA
jgi:predicted transcriptional regulator